MADTSTVQGQGNTNTAERQGTAQIASIEQSGTQGRTYTQAEVDKLLGGYVEQGEVNRLVVTKWPASLKGKRLMYQGHEQGKGWTKPCAEGQWCGTRGKSKRLEAVRIWIE